MLRLPTLFESQRRNEKVKDQGENRRPAAPTCRDKEAELLVNVGTNQLEPGNEYWKLALAKACMPMIGVLCRFQGGSAMLSLRKMADCKMFSS